MVKEIQKTLYRAFDGREFDTATECRAHERDHAPAMLVDLSAEQVQAAVTRADPDLAEAIERVAYLIASARKAAGDLKRRPKDSRDDIDATAAPDSEAA